jgi:hypothetical protein
VFLVRSNDIYITLYNLVMSSILVKIISVLSNIKPYPNWLKQKGQFAGLSTWGNQRWMLVSGPQTRLRWSLLISWLAFHCASFIFRWALSLQVTRKCSSNSTRSYLQTQGDFQIFTNGDSSQLGFRMCLGVYLCDLFVLFLWVFVCLFLRQDLTM